MSLPGLHGVLIVSSRYFLALAASVAIERSRTSPVLDRLVLCLLHKTRSLVKLGRRDTRRPERSEGWRKGYLLTKLEAGDRVKGVLRCI